MRMRLLACLISVWAVLVVRCGALMVILVSVVFLVVLSVAYGFVRVILCLFSLGSLVVMRRVISSISIVLGRFVGFRIRVSSMILMSSRSFSASYVS